jgi:hypothetical protein
MKNYAVSLLKNLASVVINEDDITLDNIVDTIFHDDDSDD